MPEPVHISKILPEVMSNIAERMQRRRNESGGDLLQLGGEFGMLLGCEALPAGSGGPAAGVETRSRQRWQKSMNSMSGGYKRYAC